VTGGPAANPLIAHFYRAVVSHGDVWRQRMDATTNWAAATTAGMVTFAFGTPAAPHVVLLLAAAFDVIFLLMESRRYQVYDLWRQRFRTLNRFLIAPVLADEHDARADAMREGLALLASDLGRTVPSMRHLDAVGYRIRRNYGYIFALVLCAWLLKLEMHPTTAVSLREFVGRAAVGTLPGGIVFAGVALALGVAAVLAARAPSEGMVNWTITPSPLDRFVSQSRRWVPGADLAAGELRDRELRDRELGDREARS
jgi:uncharacterized membrane protein